MRVNGIKEALILLQGLSPSEQKKLIEKMKAMDPKIAEFLESHLVNIEDIKKLTPKMLQKFLQGLDYRNLGMALRGTSEELQGFIKSNTSLGIWSEVEDVLLGKPQPLSKVQEAQAILVNKLKDGIDQGQYVLSDDTDVYV